MARKGNWLRASVWTRERGHWRRCADGDGRDRTKRSGEEEGGIGKQGMGTSERGRDVHHMTDACAARQGALGSKAKKGGRWWSLRCTLFVAKERSARRGEMDSLE